jgi:hypothetical protein
MIVIAILDDAFEANVRYVEDVLYTQVKAPRLSLQFRWKESIRKSPIFRQAVPTASGIRTSDTKAVRYHTCLYYLQRLGLAAGFMKLISGYDRDLAA